MTYTGEVFVPEDGQTPGGGVPDPTGERLGVPSGRSKKSKKERVRRVDVDKRSGKRDVGGRGPYSSEAHDGEGGG